MPCAWAQGYRRYRCTALSWALRKVLAIRGVILPRGRSRAASPVSVLVPAGTGESGMPRRPFSASWCSIARISCRMIFTALDRGLSRSGRERFSVTTISSAVISTVKGVLIRIAWGEIP